MDQETNQQPGEPQSQQPVPEPTSRTSKGGFMFSPSASKVNRVENVAPSAPPAPPTAPVEVPRTHPNQLSIRDLQRAQEAAQQAGSAMGFPPPPPPTRAEEFPPPPPPVAPSPLSPQGMGFPPPPPPISAAPAYPPPPQTQPVYRPQAPPVYAPGPQQQVHPLDQYAQQPDVQQGPPAHQYTPGEDLGEMPLPDNNLPLIAVAGAAGAGVAGVIIIALNIAFMYGLFHLFVTLFVAAGIGHLANHLGGRGPSIGIIAGLIALVAISIGKLGGVAIGFPALIREEIASALEQQMYVEQMAEADDYASVQNDGDLRTFLWNNDYTAAQNDYDVTDAELAEFRRSGTGDLLKQLADERPDYDTWKAIRVERDAEGTSWAIIPYALFFYFSIFDIVFLFIDTGIAYYLASRREGDD